MALRSQLLTRKKKIGKKELSRVILDKEAMAIVCGFKRFYEFIFGKVIILKTDNKALQLILGPRKGIPITADNRFQRWAYFLSGFRYTIEHIKSEASANCDALSRLPIDDKDCDILLLEVENRFFTHKFLRRRFVQSFNHKNIGSRK